MNAPGVIPCDVPNWLGPRGTEPGTDGAGIPIGFEGSAEPGAERRGAPGDEVGGEVTEQAAQQEHTDIKEAIHPAREMVGHSFVLSATRPLAHHACLSIDADSRGSMQCCLHLAGIEDK